MRTALRTDDVRRLRGPDHQFGALAGQRVPAGVEVHVVTNLHAHLAEVAGEDRKVLAGQNAAFQLICLAGIDGMDLAVNAGHFALTIQEHAGVVELGLGRVFGQVQRHHDVGLVPPGGSAQRVQNRPFQRHRGLLGRAPHLARDGRFGQGGNVQADMVLLPGSLAHRVDKR